MYRSASTSWLERLLEAAVALVAVGLLLNWAWRLIHPLIPFLVTIVGLAVLVPIVANWLRDRRQGW